MTRLSGYLGTRPKSPGRRQGRTLSPSTAYLQLVGEGTGARGAPPWNFAGRVTAFHVSGWVREA